MQKLSKASDRSKVENRVLFLQKLSIFFAVSGLALSIIEQETLWYTGYKASQVCPDDFPCVGGLDFKTRKIMPFVCSYDYAANDTVRPPPTHVLQAIHPALPPRFFCNTFVTLPPDRALRPRPSRPGLQPEHQAHHCFQV